MKKHRSRKPKWVHLSFADLEQRRKLHRLNIRSMADQLEVTPSTYYNWRKGRVVPPFNRQLMLKKKIAEMADLAQKDAPVLTPEGIEATASIVKAYLANGMCKPGDLPRLIHGVRRALAV